VFEAKALACVCRHCHEALPVTAPRGRKGSLLALAQVSTAVSATAVTDDELVDLVHSVAPEVRDTRTSVFVMNDNTWQTIRKLKDTTGLNLVGDLGSGAARLSGDC
jgi:HK97 family phage major capsid protein